MGFVEKVHYRSGQADHLEKLEGRLGVGVVLIMDLRSGEAFADTLSGVLTSSAIRRMTSDRRRPSADVLATRGGPGLDEQTQWERTTPTRSSEFKWRGAPKQGEQRILRTCPNQ